MSRISTKLQRRIQDKLDAGRQSVQQAADEMDVPYWVIRDTLRGATDCPRPVHLPNLARWLGISVEQVIEDAYSPLDPESLPTAANPAAVPA